MSPEELELTRKVDNLTKLVNTACPAWPGEWVFKSGNPKITFGGEGTAILEMCDVEFSSLDEMRQGLKSLLLLIDVAERS